MPSSRWATKPKISRICSFIGNVRQLDYYMYIVYAHLCVYVFSSLTVSLFATPQTAAWQAPLSMGFSMQEYCSGFPFPSPRYHPDPRIDPHL